MPRQVDNTNTSGQDMSLDSPTCVSLDGTEWRSIQRTEMEEQHGGRGREEGRKGARSRTVTGEDYNGEGTEERDSTRSLSGTW